MLKLNLPWLASLFRLFVLKVYFSLELFVMNLVLYLIWMVLLVCLLWLITCVLCYWRISWKQYISLIIKYLNLRDYKQYWNCLILPIVMNTLLNRDRNCCRLVLNKQCSILSTKCVIYLYINDLLKIFL